MQALRDACRAVSDRAVSVAIVRDAVAAYTAALPLGEQRAALAGEPAQPPLATDREHLAAAWLTLDAVNFGSGWFPTLRKRDGLSGYNTIASALSERFAAGGPWTAEQLAELDAATLAPVLGQDPEHELMGLYATSLRDLGARVGRDHAGRFAAVVDAAGGSAVTLATTLGGWACFADRSRYQELEIPFLKRAQIAAADLHRAGVAVFGDLDRLTMFADNLVPHVLRLDGILRFDPALTARIDAGDLIEHGSAEEVEIRACALHAVELVVAARSDQTCAAELDQFLWQRGQEPRYKASPRHRSRCTAY
jgi:hypothetical protein